MKAKKKQESIHNPRKANYILKIFILFLVLLIIIICEYH